MSRRRPRAKQVANPFKKRVNEFRRLLKRHQRLAILVLAVILITALSISGIYIYQEYYRKPRLEVASVNGVSITLDTYRKRILFLEDLFNRRIEELEQQREELDPQDGDFEYTLDAYNRQIESAKFDTQQVIVSAMQELIDDELIRQQAQDMGISITDQEVQEVIQRSINYVYGNDSLMDLDAKLPDLNSPSLSLEQTDELYRLEVKRAKKKTGMSEEEFRDLFAIQLLREKMSAVLVDAIPISGEHVHVRQILVETEEEAAEVVSRLEDGENFVALAAELSLDERTKDIGGDLGWFPRGTYPPVFDDIVFTLETEGEIGVIKTSAGYHVVMFIERDENKPFAPTLLEERRSGALQRWLQNQRVESDISYNVELIQEHFMSE
jgi:foldase protein PrsA